MTLKSLTKKFIRKCKSNILPRTSWNDKPQGKNAKIIVCQYGNVGSTSVVESLSRLNLGTDIHHVHFLNNLDLIKESIKKSWFYSETQMRNIEKYKKLREEIDSSFDDIHWYVITLVRDCVARNISSFFFNQAIVNQDFLKTLQQHQDNMSLITNKFFDTVGVKDQSKWFDIHIKSVFGIDVFDTPFPRKKGYSIYYNKNVSLLFFKLEKLSECANEAFKQFLGIENFQIFTKNSAKDKVYANEYKNFLNTIKIPSAELEKIYQFKMMRHFYDSNEIKMFKQRWG